MLLKLINLLKRKSMKIANRHRHITKSEHQPCITVQTHNAALLTPKDTSGDTDSSEDSPPKDGSSTQYCKAWIRTNK